MRLARPGQLGITVILIEGWDMAETAAAVEIVGAVREIARDGSQWIKIVSARSAALGAVAGRAVGRTDWRPMDEDRYNTCIDRRNYRPKKFRRRGPEVS